MKVSIRDFDNIYFCVIVLEINVIRIDSLEIPNQNHTKSFDYFRTYKDSQFP